ncbi:hypothetical protein [Clostridium sp. JS66]|uniref:hypothetical protein n=1 Tax=Clostridium sp. JS66 TaxID=3064705 RepID=UPI00298DB3FB|nr:hypothetical protein [Clostridium sp. JS66]WPC40432.1 hypothetical protein Q6H37_21380 [Clostridium sp. JS66]
MLISKLSRDPKSMILCESLTPSTIGKEFHIKEGGGISNGSDGINKKLKEDFYNFKNMVLIGRNVRRFANKITLKIKKV